jgi:hypothetical protein
MLSTALMEAVWGLLHTGMAYRYNEASMLVLYQKRSGKAPQETYMEIIRLLLDAGADPERFAYADFASVEVQKKEQEPERKRFEQAIREKGYGKTTSAFGTSDLSGTYLHYGTGGLSIMEVAEIHQAEELIELLNEYQ